MKICGFIVLGLFWGSLPAMAIEEASFTVVEQDGRFALRAYDAHIVAEIIVEGTLEKAGDRAFRSLFSYIDGNNQARTNIAMTAPVGQEKRGSKIAMTAPVGQQAVGDQWAVSFMMPASFTMASLPVPDNDAITLREVPSRRMAVVRYSGFWSEKGYTKYLKKLEEWMTGKGLQPDGEPVWARYDPPFMPWFMRRNEILIPTK